MRGTLLAAAVLAAALASAPATARADAVADEISAGTSVAAGTARSWIANRLAGDWDVDDRFSLGLGLGITRSTTASHTGSLSISYLPDDAWSISLSGTWVPAQTTASVTSLVVEESVDDILFADAELSATTSSLGLALSVDYTTEGADDRETTIALSLGVDHVQTQQTFASIVADDGRMLTADDIRALCAAQPCSPEITAALSPLWTQLSRFAIGASVVHTRYRHLDLGLDATGYIYDRDPTLAGYFRLPGSGPSYLGDGVAIAPLRYAVSPSLANQWGMLRGTLGLAYGSYLAGQGYELGARVKLQYKVRLDAETSVRLHATLASSWNVDAYADLASTLSLALGGKYTW